MEKKPLHFPVILNPNIPKEDVYLVTLASDYEIKMNQYYEYMGLKISNNPKKVGMIKDVVND